MTTLADDLNMLGTLREHEDNLKNELKAATEARAQHERAVFERMIDEGYNPRESSVRLRNRVYTPRSTVYATIQDKAALIEHLLETDEGLIDTSLRMAELNRLVREKLDNGEPLPPGLGWHEREYISVRGLALQDDTTKEVSDG